MAWDPKASCRTRYQRPLPCSRLSGQVRAFQAGIFCYCMSWARKHLRTVHSCNSRKAGKVHDHSTFFLLQEARQSKFLTTVCRHKIHHIRCCIASLAYSRAPGSRTRHQRGSAFPFPGPSERRWWQALVCTSDRDCTWLCWSHRRSWGTLPRL